MKQAIIDYIDYLKEQHGFRISIHGEGTRPYLDFLAPYNAHECVYCMYVKSSGECWKRCIESQRRAVLRLGDGGAYFGSCYAGVGEFVFPLSAFGRNVGMISVGGYLGSAEKRNAFSAKYGFREEKLSSLAHSELREDIPEMNLVRTLIEPLSAMLTLLIERGGSDTESLYGKIRCILHTGYMRKIKLSDIAAECHYSTSFISRYFKSHSGVSINEYLFTLRMEKAAELLSNTDMRIEDIAASTGFFDTNYFIHCFSKNYKISPKRYRNANKA